METRFALGEARPGQQVLDDQMKHFTHIIRKSAFNTGDKRAGDEAHNLVRQIFMQPSDIDVTTPGDLTINLDSMQTRNETKAVRELGVNLTETRTRCPGIDLLLE